MPDRPDAPLCVDDDACLELLCAALDGSDSARVDWLMRLCLLDSDASRRAGLARLAETADPLRVVLL
ncbi:hypothetical protein [Methylobacterium symbioticum]|uniref:Uncharacterized protein n=1 Tax=Methylobacterium symbioticum TaxID=2584084 RepID=A0A509E6V5_9HYPH|nr:hypothetical protein [Methylobacterium symbioticum]VUD70026.1 hypothetical protein MET9862_00587 [Methylobacterium symbioticum]